MALNVHSVVMFQRTTGVPRDVVECTFNFKSVDGVTAVDLVNINDALETFWGGAVGGTHTIGKYLNDTIVRSPAPEVWHYDLDGHLGGGPLGAPIGNGVIAIEGALAAAALPDEVAVSLSYATAYGADPEHGAGGIRPRARDRGRVYVGPLCSHADVMDTSSGIARVAGVLRTDLCLAGKAMLDELAGAGNDLWAVWSRMDAELKSVSRGWVDDAFDTQRRRGIDASTRTTFVA